MKITHLQSASVIIEHEDIKILCDPWLVDGEYFGSWALYPPFEFIPREFDDIDYIYITHIHPDHFSAKTLSQLNKNIPVIILNFPQKFLKNNIERLGFTVLEINNDERTHLKKGLHITILASDYCNPELCSKFIGCAPIETKFGATSIDTMAVIDNEKEVIVNTNDCPFELSKFSISKIKNNFNKIDMLLVGYGGAGPYPQCFEMPEQDMKDAAKVKTMQFFTQMEMFVNLLKPEYFMPFAGRYTLAGSLSKLNNFRGVPELEEAYEYAQKSLNIDSTKQKCILINIKENFNITKKQLSKKYVGINKNEKNEYIKNILAHKKYEYSNEIEPSDEEILSLIPKAFKRFESKRKEIGFESDTVILIKISDEKFLSVSCNGNGYEIILAKELEQIKKYVEISTDRKLLKWLLTEPKYAHWNNAEIGSHLRFKRMPNIYERGLYYSLSFFHS
jgi:UDP-MurNAc hydroxylase